MCMLTAFKPPDGCRAALWTLSLQSELVFVNVTRSSSPHCRVCLFDPTCLFMQFVALYCRLILMMMVNNAVISKPAASNVVCVDKRQCDEGSSSRRPHPNHCSQVLMQWSPSNVGPHIQPRFPDGGRPRTHPSPRHPIRAAFTNVSHKK